MPVSASKISAEKNGHWGPACSIWPFDQGGFPKEGTFSKDLDSGSSPADGRVMHCVQPVQDFLLTKGVPPKPVPQTFEVNPKRVSFNFSVEFWVPGPQQICLPRPVVRAADTPHAHSAASAASHRASLKGGSCRTLSKPSGPCYLCHRPLPGSCSQTCHLEFSTGNPSKGGSCRTLSDWPRPTPFPQRQTIPFENGSLPRGTPPGTWHVGVRQPGLIVSTLPSLVPLRDGTGCATDCSSKGGSCRTLASDQISACRLPATPCREPLDGPSRIQARAKSKSCATARASASALSPSSVHGSVPEAGPRVPPTSGATVQSAAAEASLQRFTCFETVAQERTLPKGEDWSHQQCIDFAIARATVALPSGRISLYDVDGLPRSQVILSETARLHTHRTVVLVLRASPGQTSTLLTVDVPT